MLQVFHQADKYQQLRHSKRLFWRACQKVVRQKKTTTVSSKPERRLKAAGDEYRCTPISPLQEPTGRIAFNREPHQTEPCLQSQ